MLDDEAKRELDQIFAEAITSVPNSSLDKVIPRAQYTILLKLLEGHIQALVAELKPLQGKMTDQPSVAGLDLQEAIPAFLFLIASRGYIVAQYQHQKSHDPVSVDYFSLVDRLEELFTMQIDRFLTPQLDYLLLSVAHSGAWEILNKAEALRSIVDTHPEGSSVLQLPFYAAVTLGAFVWQVANQLQTVGSPRRAQDITLFLSYSQRDAAKVRRIEKELERIGFKTWRDGKDIAVGQPILDRIRDGVTKDADFALIFLSAHSVNSEWCKAEVRMAYERELKSKAVFSLPVLLGDCEVPPELQIKKYADLRSGIKNGVRQIAEGIQFCVNNATVQQRRKNG